MASKPGQTSGGCAGVGVGTDAARAGGPGAPAAPAAAVRKPSAKADGAPAPAPTTFGPAKVLVADDEYTLATGIAANVTDLGHTVVGIARDGEEAVQMARDLKPDLALLDIRMPKMLGVDAAMVLFGELKVPSIIVSAYSDAEYLAKIHAHGEAAGVYGYLIKPVTTADLKVQIGVALQRAAIDGTHAARITQLETNLANRRTVEHAKWILVAKRKITEPDAHDLLQKVARDRRKPLLEIAQGVIAAGDLP
jgi:response regulator NasT